MDNLDVSISPDRLLEFHGWLVSDAQSDERSGRAWEATELVDRREREAELREAWQVYYLRLS